MSIAALSFIERSTNSVGRPSFVNIYELAKGRKDEDLFLFETDYIGVTDISCWRKVQFIARSPIT